MPIIVWIVFGLFAIIIIAAITGNWSVAIFFFIVAVIGGAIFGKLHEWGLLPDVITDTPIHFPTRSTEPITQVQPPPPLPEPIRPNSNEPIRGTMRVDVTRTDQTVDVWIQLSEEAKFIVESNSLESMPVEEHFEELKERLAEFSREYDYIQDDIDADIERQLRSPDALRKYQEIADEGRYGAKRSKPENLKKFEEDYKRTHSVTLGQYLAYPHRHLIHAPLEANLYIEQLETKYLPPIKAAIDAASQVRQPQTKTYQF